jgi:ribonuclease BN (tRNA processing enzyme)
MPGVDGDNAGAADGGAGAALCVLASGSAGNCTVVAVRRGGVTRACLIDLGLSPRRTVRLLAGLGLGLHQVDDVILTHLDSDHVYTGWLGARGLPRHVRLHVHARHAEAAGLPGLFGPAAVVYEDGLVLRDGTRVRAVVAPHDRLGVAALRMEGETGAGADGGLRAGTGGEGWSLGYATDVGRVEDELVEHLRGVDVLAIESNYCPRMQVESGRPLALIERIMGGRGHLSNQEAVEAIGRIAPRRHVVLLHLSRQCNDPAVVASLHAGAGYGVTISSQEAPTGWVAIAGAAPAAAGVDGAAAGAVTRRARRPATRAR